MKGLGGQGQGPQKARSVGNFKFTSKENLPGRLTALNARDSATGVGYRSCNLFVLGHNRMCMRGPVIGVITEMSIWPTGIVKIKSRKSFPDGILAVMRGCPYRVRSVNP